MTIGVGGTRAAPAIVAIGIAVGAGAATARAQAVEIELDARVDIERRRVAGRVSYAVDNPTADAIDRIYLWLHLNRFATRPVGLDDVNFHWVYPDRVDPGWMRVTTVEGGEARVAPHAVAGRDTLVEVKLDRAIAPGETARVVVDFQARVPEKYGSIGCVDGGCVLAGGFYPLVAAIDEAGWDLAAPPAWSDTRARIALARPGSAASSAGVSTQVVELRGARGPYAPIVIAPELHVVEREHRGVTIAHVSRRAPPPADDAERQILPYSEEDYAKMALDAAAQAVDLLVEIGAPIPAGARLTLVEAPLRLDLAQAHPGLVLVSDRLFRLFPVKRFRKFHERELVRAIYTEWLARQGAALPARERDAAAEAAAGYLLDLYTLREWRRAEFARDLLSPVSFVPQVDQLLYAPQIAFADAYFGSVADTDRFRDDARRFMHERPRGHLVYEKLRDLLDAERFGDTMRAVIVDGTTLRDAAESASARPLGWFFRQWGGPYPKVNYRLGARRRERQGDAWRHTVEVEKQTPDGGRPPVEPVDVRVVDGSGKRHDLRWDGDGERGTLSFESRSGSIDTIEIDPRRRLVESGASATSDDPRFDNRSPPRLKFLYNGFGALLNFTDLSLGLLWDFSFRRVHDTRNNVRFTVFAGGPIDVGGSIAYSRHFGRAVTPLRRASSAGVGLSVSRLDGDFANAPSDGTRVSVAVGLGTDDRLYPFHPLRARGASVGARWSLTRFDDAAAGSRQTVSIAGDLTRIFTPIEGHTFVVNLEGAAIAGDIVTRGQLLAAGGPGGLRGYLPDELFGRARLLGHAEWRGSLRHDLDVNVGHWIVLHGVGAALFTDVGALSSCDRYDDLFAPDNLYADVGFGLRLFYDNLGVQPGMMALDFAIPLVVRPRECLTGEPNVVLDRPPFMLYLTFLPPF